MRGVPLYVWAFAFLSLMLVAVYFYPLIIGGDFEPGADGALEGAILTSYEPTPAQKKEILNVEKTYDVTRGEASSFDVSVSNPFQSSAIVGLDLTLGGSFAKYMEVEALERIDADGEKIEIGGSPGDVGLAYGETQKYKITTFAPAYVDRGTYFVDLEIHKGTVTYRDYPAGETALRYKDITFEIIEKRTVAITVHTFSEEEASATYEESALNIGLMRDGGFLSSRVERLLDEARAEMSDGDYEAAVEKGIEISKIKEDAFSSRDGIAGLQELILDAEDVRGLKVPETKELLGLAQAAFEREDYETARDRVREGELVYASETRGRINYQKLILDNIFAVVLGAVAFFVISIFTFRVGSLVLSASRLRGLDAKDNNIKQLMKGVQESYYIQKRFSNASYQNAMAEFSKKLAENQSERAGLKARRTGVLWRGENLKSLKLERKNLEELIRDTQVKYYSKKTISRSEYSRTVEQYRAMGADVEEKIAVLELGGII